MKKQELKDVDFLNVFIKTKKFFKSHFIIIALFTVLGGGLSVANYYLSNNYYTTSFATSNGSVVEGVIIQDIINHFQSDYINSDNLKLNQEKINAIQQDFLNIKDLQVDTSTKDRLIFELKIYDNQVDLTSLENSITSIFINDIYLAEHSTNRKIQLETELKSIATELLTIDSLQKIMLSNPKTMMASFTNFSNNIVRFKNHQFILKEELNKLGEYNIIRKIYKPKSPKRSLKSAILFGSILGFFLSIIFGVLRQLNRLSKGGLN